MAEATDDGRIATYLKNNPRMMGVVFSALVLISQATVVWAGNGAGTGNGGP